MTQYFRVELELGNDAMKTTRDVSQMLVKVVGKLVAGPIKPLAGKTRLHDDNGNTVGFFEFVEEERESSDPGNDC